MKSKAEYTFEKRSNLLGAGLLHGTQNYLTRTKFLKPRKEYLESFLEGVTNKPFKSKKKSFFDGLVSGTVSPEYGEINKRMTTLGKNVSKSDLTKRQLVTLRKAARGKLDKKDALTLKRTMSNPATKPIVDAVKKNLGVDVDLKKMDWDKATKSINNNKSLRVFESLFEKAPLPKSNTTLKSNKNWNNAGKGTGVSAITAVDPIAGAMNTKKWFLMSDKAKNIKPIKKAQDKARSWVVTNPSKKQFNKGLEGKERSKGKKIFDDIVFNPLVSDAKTFSNSMGLSARSGVKTK